MNNTLQHRNWISRTSRAGTSAALTLAVVLALAVMTAQPAQAQTTFTILHNFDGTDGNDVFTPLVQGTNGNLYGTTIEGGANGAGTVFKITLSGTLTTVYSFCSLSGCADGEDPVAGLVQATNGDLYGTTRNGGNAGCGSDCGTAFKITPSGTLTTLYSFCEQPGCTDGINPEGALVQATNGDLYGTTNFDGANSGWGTLFKMTPSGALTTLDTFCYGCATGNMPVTPPIQATNGDLYGTTPTGGAGNPDCTYGCGAVYRSTLSGTLTALYSFCSKTGCTDGSYPLAALVQASNGNFYGTTQTGGANNLGTVFELTPAGKLTTLYNFCSQSACADGSNPEAALVQGTDGNFYGTTTNGGNVYNGATGYCFSSYGCGTAFKITPSGTLTTLYSFCEQPGCTDGFDPQAALLQDTDGTFYGEINGGANNCNEQANTCGIIYSLSTGLGPFVETQTGSGKEGAQIGVLGQGFSSSSVVEFGGVPAISITRQGTTFIKATVPPGALTGNITVTTGSVTLTSNKTFRVTPTISSFAPPSGPVGQAVTINGTGLMQATKVTFNGTSASFTVNSDIEITATVPTGATTGKIAVTTAGGNAASATSFTVN
jgi:uncharacterized repeat protein (TIGR03803 family)